MRQVGILAAAGLVGLEKVVPLLPKDHEHTKRIAEGKGALGLIYIYPILHSLPSLLQQLISFVVPTLS